MRDARCSLRRKSLFRTSSGTFTDASEDRLDMDSAKIRALVYSDCLRASTGLLSFIRTRASPSYGSVLKNPETFTLKNCDRSAAFRPDLSSSACSTALVKYSAAWG